MTFMELSDVIKLRHSVRAYADKQVEKEKINECLKAAQLAPSACNFQPWKFIIVDDKALKDKLFARAFSGIYSMNSFVKEAKVIVVLVSERQNVTAAVGSYLRGTKFYLLDAGMAAEHFVLKAAELGLGTCYIGWFNEKEVKKTLNIPVNKKIDVLISMGYPKQQEVHDHARLGLDEISSFNKY